jgi:hypothetical protein
MVLLLLLLLLLLLPLLLPLLLLMVVVVVVLLLLLLLCWERAYCRRATVSPPRATTPPPRATAPLPRPPRPPRPPSAAGLMRAGDAAAPMWQAPIESSRFENEKASLATLDPEIKVPPAGDATG